MPETENEDALGRASSSETRESSRSSCRRFRGIGFRGLEVLDRVSKFGAVGCVGAFSLLSLDVLGWLLPLGPRGKTQSAKP